MRSIGRPPKEYEIMEVRELSLSEVMNVKRGQVPAVQRFRDSHHKMAQLFAMGLRPTQVAEITGYSLSRVSILRANPAFDDLVVQKRGLPEGAIKDAITSLNQMILENGLKAERKLADKLDDDDDTEELSVRELISISRDAADRVGLSKRSLQVNVTADFASSLDRAIARTREVLPRSGDLTLVASATDGLKHGVLDVEPPGRGSVIEAKVVRFLRRM